jgi:hypothetical protein
MWCGDGLGAPDSVLGRAGPKRSLGRVARRGQVSDAPQIPLENALVDAAGDALRHGILRTLHTL